MSVQEWADAAIAVAQAGGWAIAILLVFTLVGGVWTGRLVSSQQYKDIRTDRAERLASSAERVSEMEAAAERWRTAHAVSEDARKDQAELLREVLTGDGPVPMWNGSGRHAGAQSEG